MVETARGTVHEWQRDHMGHINVRAYMEFFEEACWQLYSMLGLTASKLRAGAVHLAAVQQNIRYSKELYPGDTVAVRSLVGTEDSRAVAAWSFILITPPSLILAGFVWEWPSAAMWPVVAGIGGAAAVGQLAMARAFALAEASAVLPYDFVRFGLISVAGIVLFGERLDGWTLAGGAVILGSSIYIAVREAQVARAGRD